jgi:hypothetical protein
MSVDGSTFDRGGRTGRRFGRGPLLTELPKRSIIVIDVAIFQEQADGEFCCFSASQLNVSQLAQIPMDERNVRDALRRKYCHRFQGMIPAMNDWIRS